LDALCLGAFIDWIHILYIKMMPMPLILKGFWCNMLCNSSGKGPSLHPHSPNSISVPSVFSPTMVYSITIFTYDPNF
jgi:hypothetical protein